jgi:ABC-type antimicrobial peptide transport system permease subunit
MRYAWDALRRRPGRSAITVLGIGLATGLVVLLLALSAGITSSASALAQSSGVDLLATSANTSLTDSGFPPITGAHGLAERARAADPNVVSASPWLVSDLVFANASLYAASNSSPTGALVPGGWGPTDSGIVGWIPGDNAGIEIPPLLAGAGFTNPGDPHYSNGTYAGASTHAIVLDQALAGVLRVGVGATVWMAARAPTGPAGLAAWFANATPMRVTGVSGPFWLIPSALLGFAYLSEVQSVLGGPSVRDDEASLLLIHLQRPGSAATDQGTLEAALPGLTVFTVAQILGAVASVVDLYQTFGDLIGVIGLAVATLFTATVLLMSVDDRSREIALLRALGFGPGWVAREVLFEGVLLALLGLAVGAPLGYLGALGVDRILGRLVRGLPASFSFVQFSPGVVATGLVLVLAIAFAAAGLPVLRALRLPIAEELRAP